MSVVTEPREKGESASDAIGVLYRFHRERLWRALVAFTGDREIASDATAEAFAQLLRRGSVVRDPASWAWRAAFRIASGSPRVARVDGRRSSGRADRRASGVPPRGLPVGLHRGCPLEDRPYRASRRVRLGRQSA